MKTSAIALGIGLVFCFLPFARGEEAPPPKRQLHFEVSSEKVGIGSIDRDYDLKYPDGRWGKPIRPTYMTKLILLKNSYSSDTLDLWNKKIISDKTWNEPQKSLIWQGAYSIRKSSQPSYNEIYLYGMSEADARAMAETLVSFLDDEAEKILESIKKNLEEKQRQIKEIEDAIPELESKHKSAEKEVFNSARVVGVGYEYIKYVNPAEEIVRELIPMLVKLDVEIKGLEAKVKALQILMNQGTEKTQETVHQMLIEQEVELAGARTRAQEMKNQQVHAMVLIEAHEKAGQLYTDILNRKKELEKLQKEIPSIENTLANPRARMRPVEVLDNKVEIIPLAL